MTVKSQSLGLPMALLAGALALGASGAALAQPGANPGIYPSTEYSPPASKRVTDRTSFSGTWDRYNAGGFGAPGGGGRGGAGAPGAAPAAQAPPRAGGPPTPPPSPPPGRAPLKPEIQAKVDELARLSREADARHEPIAGDAVACLPEGFPAMMNAIFPIEFLVTPGQVTIIEEAYNQVRRIYLDEKQGEIGDVEPVWFGHSVGHWEGKTLVVDTIGVKAQAKFRNIPHSDQMRVTERMKLLSPDFLQDEVTIVDPVVQTAPWTFTWVYKRNPGYKIQEYVCEAPREYKDENGATRLRVTK